MDHWLIDHKLINRYFDTDLNDPKDDIPTMRRVFHALFTKRDKDTPRSFHVRQRILEQLDTFPLGQVVMAAYTFLNEEVVDKISHPYDRYFLAMVRNDAGHWQQTAQAEEIHLEQVQARQRKAERRDTPPPDTGGDSSFHTPGDIFPELREMWGPSDNDKDSRPPEPGELKDPEMED